jgi:lipooligosaccharide transport system permease protein
MSFAPASHVFVRNWLVYRRIWHRSIVFGFLQPFMFLTAMGIGMGALLAQNPDAFGGLSYIEFLGPGLLAASSMQLGTFESTYPIMNKIMWGRNYEAMLATPLNTRNILLGELSWMGFRMATLAAVFMIVLWLFGIVASPIAVLAVPVATLLGLGFATWLIGYTATQKNDLGFTWIFRFVINPLFLFSGTFFPLTQLPQPLVVAAWATPLFHGVELIRGLTLDRLDPVAAPLHLLYLIVFFGIGIWWADRNLARRLAV